jgi:polygalacturonase
MSTFRPQFIETNHSANVLIEDVKIRNTPFWIVHPLNSRNVLVRDLDALVPAY